MAEPVHERVSAATSAMETAIYAALDAIDAYQTLVRDERDAATDNDALAKRMRQFDQKSGHMIQVIEDEVLTDLNFCTDRLFSVALAERGEFI